MSSTLKQKIVLIFKPAWSCPEVLAPLIAQIESRGAKAVVIKNPDDSSSLKRIYKGNLPEVGNYIRGDAQVVGLGISQGSHSLSKIARIADAEDMKGIILYGSPMLSRRVTFKSLTVLLRIIFTPAYWGIFGSLFNSACEDVSLKRKDVVKLLFGEDRAEWKNIIDAVAKQKAPPGVLAEMMFGLIQRVTFNMPVRVIRASEEVFHSNDGALAWLKKKPHYHSRDAYRLVKGHHFGALVEEHSVAEIAKEAISLFD